MALTCPNVNLKEFKDLVAERGKSLAYYEWIKANGDITQIKPFNNLRKEDQSIRQKLVANASNEANANKMLIEFDNLRSFSYVVQDRFGFNFDFKYNPEDVSEEGRVFRSKGDTIGTIEINLAALQNKVNQGGRAFGESVVLHELLHPFINTIQVDNRGLFNSLMKEAKADKKRWSETLNFVNKEYKDDSINEREKEALIRIMERESRKAFDKKNKTTLFQSLLQEFWTMISELFSSITGRTIEASELPNMSMQKVINELAFGVQDINLRKPYALLKDVTYKKAAEKENYPRITFEVGGEEVTADYSEVTAVLEGVDYYFMDTLFKDGDATRIFSSSSLDINDIYRETRRKFQEYVDPNNAEGFIANVDKNSLDYLVPFYNAVSENWNEIMAYHAKSLNKYGINIRESENEEEDKDAGIESGNNYEDGRNMFAPSIEWNTKHGTPKIVRLLIAGLPKLSKAGMHIVNGYGMRKLNDYNSTYDFLAKHLANTSATYDKFFEKLRNLQNIRPEITELITRLEKPTKHSESLKTKFIQNFSKHIYTYLLGLEKENGDIVFQDSNSDKLNNKLLAETVAEFEKDLVISSTEEKAITDEKITYAKNKIAEVKELLERARKTPIPYKKNELFDEAFKTLGFEISGNLINKTTIDALNGIVNNYKGKKSLFDRKSGVAGSIDVIINEIVENSSETVELQHRSPDGKSIYGITLNTYISLVTTKLNEIASLQTEAERETALMEELPHIAKSLYATNSVILRKLIQDGKRVTFDILHGVKSEVTGDRGKVLKDLNKPDKYQTYFNSTLKGHYSLLRAADRGNENVFTLEGKGQFKPLFATSEIEALNIMLGYYEDEVATRDALNKEGVGNDIRYYRDNAKNLRVFSSINKTGNINRDILTYLEGRYEAETQNLLDAGVITKANGVLSNIGISKDILATYDSIEEAIKSFVWNSTIANIEQTKLFIGDLAYYKSPAEVFKRISMANSTKKVSRYGQDFSNYLDAIRPRLDGKIGKARQEVKTIVFDDIAAKTKKEYNDTLESIFTDSLLKDGFGKDSKLSDSGKNILKSFMAPYLDMEEGDAQGYVTLDEYRDILERAGDWTDSHEAIYKKAINNEKISLKELFYFPPLKTQYVGPLTSLESKNEGLYVHSGYKHSLLPLIPSMFEGTQMKALIDYMTKNKVGIAQFATANKFGVIVDSETGKANEFYTEEGDINLNDLTPQFIDHKYLGIQLDIAPKTKTSLTTGTQQAKLIMANLVDRGLSQNFGGVVEEYNKIQSDIITDALQQFVDELSIYQDEEGNYGIGDYNKFTEFLLSASKSRNASDNVLNAIKALNVIEEGEVVGLRYIDTLLNKEKVENLLMALVNNNVIRVKRSGASKVQVASTGFEVNARTREGGYYTSNELNFYKKDPKSGKILSMEVMVAAPKKLLKKYGTVENLNKALEEARQEGYSGPNTVLKKITEIIGFRIPTQGMNSIDNMVIKKFLPAEAGDIIVMPTEIVAKSGSDYDIDKLNIYMPNFDLEFAEAETLVNSVNKVLKRNNLYTLEEGSEGALQLADIIEEGDESLDGLNEAEKLAYRVAKSLQPKYGNIKYINPAKSNTRKAKENRIIELNKQILSHPDNARQLLAPISDILLFDGKNPSNTKPLVNYIRFLRNRGQVKEDTTTLTNVVEAETNVDKFVYFLSGKAGVGQTAVHITNHVLTQIANTYIKDSNIGIYFKHNKTTIDGTEYPSLGGIRDVNGNWISESLSAFMNAYVDIAKDPYIFDLNATSQTANVVFYMLRLGVDPVHLATFMAQPIITDYLNNSYKFGSEFRKAKRKALTKGKIIDKTLQMYSRNAKNKNLEYYYRRELKDKQSRGYLAQELANLVDKIDSFNYRQFTNRELANMISAEKLSNEEKKNQIQILDNFLELERQSTYMQKMIRATSPDTKGVGKSINSLEYMRNERNEVLNSDNFFGNVQPIFDNTFIGMFEKATEVAYKTYSPLYISKALPKVKRNLDRIKLDIASFLPGVFNYENIARRVDSQFINYLLKTHPTEGIAIKFNRLMGKSKTSLPRRISTIKNGLSPKHISLKNNELIKELTPILDRPTQDNLKIFNRKLDTLKENGLMYAFEEILETDKKLADDIVTFALLQNATEITPISYTKFIPEDIVNAKMNRIFGDLIDGNTDVNYDQFEDQFYRNNIDLVPMALIDYATTELDPELGTVYKRNYSQEGDIRKYVPYIRSHKGELYKNNGEGIFSFYPQYQRLGDKVNMYYSDYKPGNNTNKLKKKASDKEVITKKKDC